MEGVGGRRRAARRIGGGAILRLKDSVKGTATAASLWATGAMGTAVGLGSYDVAIVLSLITLLTLWVLSPLKTELVNDGPDEAGAGDVAKDGEGKPRSSLGAETPLP